MIGMAVWLGVLVMVPIYLWRGQSNRWFEILLPLAVVPWLWSTTIGTAPSRKSHSKRVAWLLTIAGLFVLFGRVWNLIA